MALSRYMSLFLWVTLFIGVNNAQDLESAWQAYLNTNNQRTLLQEQHQQFLVEQNSVNAEVARLRKSAAWYNAWLNKWLLSGYTHRQLQLTDSLQSIEADIKTLTRALAKDQSQLTHAYASILGSVDDAGLLSLQDQSTTLRVGRWLSTLPDEKVSLPDYHHLVEDQYPNLEIRQLVLADVQTLLRKKISQLDSLLVEKTKEEQLANRLAAFHEDLGLQMEVEQDVQARDQDGEPLSLSAWGGASGVADAASERFSDEMSTPIGASQNKADDAVILSSRRSVLLTGSHNPQSIENPDYLEAKKNEYTRLLLAIEMELSFAP